MITLVDCARSSSGKILASDAVPASGRESVDDAPRGLARGLGDRGRHGKTHRFLGRGAGCRHRYPARSDIERRLGRPAFAISDLSRSKLRAD